MRAASAPEAVEAGEIVRYADWVVAVTDNLVRYPACPIEITQDQVDFVVQVDSIGDPKGIVSGITLDFNVNVTTGTGGYAKVVEQVTTITTPGETVDALVTEEGVAVNPKRADLRDRLLAAGLPVVLIEQLRERAEQRADKLKGRSQDGRVVAVVEYRDGTVIDVVREVG